MKEIGDHFIEKISVDIYSKSVENAKSIEQNIDAFITEYIIPSVEKYLDELEKELHYASIQIPNISISLDLMEEDFSDLKFVQQAFINQFKKAISEAISTNAQNEFKGKQDGVPMQQSWVEESLSKVSREGNLTFNSAENTLKSWIYFLEYGSLPWWYSVNQAKENFTWKRISTLLNNPLDKEGLLKRFQHSSFFERVLSQYSNEDISQLIWMLIEKNALIDKSQYGQILERLDNELKISFFRLILGLSLKKILNDREYTVFQVYYSKVITSKREIVEKIFREVIKFDDIKGRKKVTPVVYEFLEGNNVFTGELPALKKEREVTPEDSIDAYYISNAGLILLHPFLKAFFIDCQLMDENANIVDKDLAVHTLHFLSTKEERAFDFELVFEKYLIGLSPEITVAREVKISNEIKEKTEKLILALKENWKRLGNTGIDTIRNEFIKRDGKLVIEEHSNRLFVERKVQDILLDSIPWNISLVKLPWQHRHLFVDW
ncbi:contractile injection system tape measure protein [Cyclobacterium marinum]|uniref:contractile injection system tape measure protein n=1 Tax=Cyclobacterium marinum TaxID=104 RepID=UPI0011EF0CB4|nr:contractile injection system tape measure protein [Cyclobacterium marinum]MBI0398293.1 hypothetical protein [Cyclobacterium marinum]